MGFFCSQKGKAKCPNRRYLDLIAPLFPALCPEQASKLELTSARARLEPGLRWHSETVLAGPRGTDQGRVRGEAAGKKESVSLDDISSSQAAAKREAAPAARRKELRFDSVVHDVESDALRIVSERIAREPHGANTATWRLLEEEISDVKLLMETCTERRGRGSRLGLLTF